MSITEVKTVNLEQTEIQICIGLHRSVRELCADLEKRGREVHGSARELLTHKCFRISTSEDIATLVVVQVSSLDQTRAPREYLHKMAAKIGLQPCRHDIAACLCLEGFRWSWLTDIQKRFDLGKGLHVAMQPVEFSPQEYGYFEIAEIYHENGNHLRLSGHVENPEYPRYLETTDYIVFEKKVG